MSTEILPLEPKIKLLVSTEYPLMINELAFELNEIEDTDEYTRHSRWFTITHNEKSAPAKIVYTLFKHQEKPNNESTSLEGCENFFNTFDPAERTKIVNYLEFLLEINIPTC